MSEPAGARYARMAGAEVVRPGGSQDEPTGATIDSRGAGSGDLFVGLAGASEDGGAFAGAALEAGAWGVLVGMQWARELASRLERSGGAVGPGWILGADDPLAALQRLGRSRRRELGCPVVGVTGSTGKTSVKDICAAILPLRVHASPENFNTEIGLPLAILAAPVDTEAMVLEMGMRGAGQIAELCAIAEPDVGVITNVGPVHVELLGSVEAVAAAKAEIVAGVGAEGTAVVPAAEPLLAGHLDGARLITFGEGGDVSAAEVEGAEEGLSALVTTPAGAERFAFPFAERHNLTNALAAIATGVALGQDLESMAARTPRIVFSRLRGETVALPGGATLINDCYNANPVSMRAALDHLGSLEARGRRLAVLGEMRELGPDSAEFHREAGAHARAVGVDLLIGVGELAGEYSPDIYAGDAGAAASALEPELAEGDVVLVKGSRAVGLELIAERLGGEERDG